MKDWSDLRLFINISTGCTNIPEDYIYTAGDWYFFLYKKQVNFNLEILNMNILW